MQAQDVINRALRALGIIASGETATASDSADALAALNAMLAEWRGADIPIPDFSVASLVTDLSVDAADHDAIALKLADRIGGEYGASLSDRDVMNMENAFNNLRLRYFVMKSFDGEGMPYETSDRSFMS